MPKNISFRIRRIYYDQIVEGTKTFELRPTSPYWDKKFQNFGRDEFIGGQAVFVCGKDVHRREITKIHCCYPSDRLGRALSVQGQKDIPTMLAWSIELGEVVEKGGNP